MDKYSYRMVIFALSCSATALCFGALGIAYRTGDVPPQLTSMGLAAFGILGGLLTPTLNQNK